MVKEMDTFLVKFDPLGKVLERCKDHFIILGKMYGCDVTEETGSQPLSSSFSHVLFDTAFCKVPEIRIQPVI